MTPEFAHNIYEPNPHLSKDEFNLLATAVGLALSDVAVARQVLRPEDFSEWRRYIEHGFPSTRNGCSITTQLFARILGEKMLIAYGMVSDRDPFEFNQRIGEHYRGYISVDEKQTFAGLDLGNKSAPLSISEIPSNIVPLDASFNQFVTGALFTLYRLRSYDQFNQPQHADTHRRTNIFAEQIRAILKDSQVKESILEHW